jgi:uncharacterized protein (TIGR03067 family)
LALELAMIFRNAAAIGLSFLVAASLVAGGATDDSKALDGQWKLIAAARDGSKENPKGELKNIIVTIAGNKLTINEAKATPQRRALVVDPSKSPKWIDMIWDEVPGRENPAIGIYKVEGDKLVVCFLEGAKEEAKKRPTEFAIPEGSGFQLITLQRMK